MANAINYASRFERELAQKFTRELRSGDLRTDAGRFSDAKTIKIPRMTLAGYKEHGRNGGWNRQNVESDYETKTLTHDRDVEFFVDVMDVDESNQVASAANITNVFTTEHSIPEIDKYRFSKLHTEVTALGYTPITTALTASNILTQLDAMVEKMDEAEVPEEGRVLYLTPAVEKLLKQAIENRRIVGVGGNSIDRRLFDVDSVALRKVPSSRMLTVYDFSDGVQPGTDAKQINMILLHPAAILAPVKHSAIYLHAPGTHTTGDGWLYQNRIYLDLFVIERKAAGIEMNVSA